MHQIQVTIHPGTRHIEALLLNMNHYDASHGWLYTVDNTEILTNPYTLTNTHSGKN